MKILGLLILAACIIPAVLLLLIPYWLKDYDHDNDLLMWGALFLIVEMVIGWLGAVGFGIWLVVR